MKYLFCSIPTLLLLVLALALSASHSHSSFPTPSQREANIRQLQHQLHDTRAHLNCLESQRAPFLPRGAGR